jgi:heptosyltransferase-2
MKIIIFALSGIGDALMFSPALKLLRQRFPDARIELLAMFKGVAELYERNPDLDKVYFWNFLSSNPFSSLAFIFRLRRKQFDVSFNVYPSNRWPYNLISFLVGAKKRLGHDYHHVNTRSLNFLNNVRVLEDDGIHNVEENRRLVELIGVDAAPELPPLQVMLNETDESAAVEWLQRNNLARGALIGYHTGSALFKNHIHKRWGAEKFAQLGELLVTREHATVLLFGGPEEYPLNEGIVGMMGGGGIVVKVPTLMTSVAIMKRCSLFVTNDSGLMHIAAGLQLPMVAIFAYTSPAKVRPWQAHHVLIRRDLPCSPCFYFSPRSAHCIWKEDAWRCITQIEVEEVYRAATGLLHENKRS